MDKIVYLDFDGTVVEHKYPDIGQYNDGCKEVIDLLRQRGYKIILNTLRANLDIVKLEESISYLKNKNIKIDGYTKEKIIPPYFWNLETNQLKIFIDDIIKNIPLKENMVDWYKVKKDLENYQII